MTNGNNHFDLIVIGSGSAGSSCWYAARQAGKSVAVFESDVLGGECPTFACVPTKALLHCAEVLETVRGAARFGIDTGAVGFDYGRVKAWKDHVVAQTGAARGEEPYREMGVHVVRHAARFVSPGEVEAGGERYTADRFLIATGARQNIPDIDGLAEAGFLTFRDAIDLTEAPASLLVLGGGPVGCEFTHLFSSFGTKVTVADRNGTLLHGEDPEAGAFLQEHFRNRGVGVLLDAAVSRIELAGAQKRVIVSQGERDLPVVVGQILVATGKLPNVDLGLEAAGVAYDPKEGVTVDQQMRTSNPRVFAAGDVAGPYRFTHAAGYQGALAWRNMSSNHQETADYSAMPRCVFTSPEVAAVGLTEQQAREQGIEVKVGRAVVEENDRALTSGETRGFVKVIAAADGRLIGGVAVAPRAGELVHELVLAIRLGATAAQVASTVHAFPTFSEALAAACSNV